MVERGRFPDEFLSNYLNLIDATHFAGFRPLPFNFQSHFYHGVMNSLGVREEPNELFLHAFAIIECKHFHSSDELCAWIRSARAETKQPTEAMKTELDFDQVKAEKVRLLEENRDIVLATSLNNRVTARAVRCACALIYAEHNHQKADHLES